MTMLPTSFPWASFNSTLVLATLVDEKVKRAIRDPHTSRGRYFIGPPGN
jgi:hypothetical protein